MSRWKGNECAATRRRMNNARRGPQAATQRVHATDRYTEADAHLLSSHCAHVQRLPFCGARRRSPPSAAAAVAGGPPLSLPRCCSTTAQGRMDVVASRWLLCSSRKARRVRESPGVSAGGPEESGVADQAIAPGVPPSMEGQRQPLQRSWRNASLQTAHGALAGPARWCVTTSWPVTSLESRDQPSRRQSRRQHAVQAAMCSSPPRIAHFVCL